MQDENGMDDSECNRKVESGREVIAVVKSLVNAEH